MPAMKKALVLWDVDHTLIENGGVSKETYLLAYQMMTGRPSLVSPETDGRTDYQIMHELFSANGSVLTDKTGRQLHDVLVSAMRRNADTLRERGHALPGAADSLALLGAQPHIAQSVLTGNILPNARVKLQSFGLDAHVDFEIGGYGSDDIARPRLVGVAQGKASAKFAGLFDATSTLLIGDTPLDVAAGLQGGARVLGVATGKSSADELATAGAHLVIPDLTDRTRLLSCLTELLPRGSLVQEVGQ